MALEEIKNKIFHLFQAAKKSEEKTAIDAKISEIAEAFFNQARYPQQYKELWDLIHTQVSDCSKLLEEKLLIEVVKKAVFQDHSRISAEISSFGITDQQALFEIAKIAAAQDGGGTSLKIQNYGIRDEKARIAIAKIAAAQNGDETSFNIQNYGITKEKDRIAIAKIAAQNGFRISEAIKNYGITNQQALIAIAKIAAAQSGSWTSVHIRKYGITDQQALIGIAKIAVAQNGSNASLQISNYGITDQQALIAIATIAVSQDGKILLLYINQIRSRKALFHLFLVGLAQNTEILEYLDRVPKLRSICTYSKAFSKTFEQLSKQQYDAVLENLPPSIKAITGEISSIKEKAIQKNLLIWLVHFLASCEQKEISLEALDLTLVQEALHYHHPTFRYKLTEAILNLASSVKARRLFNEAAKKIKPSGLLPLLFITLLEDQGTACSELITLANHRFCRDSKNLKLFVYTLFLILTNTMLNVADKKYLLERIGDIPVSRSNFDQLLNYLYKLNAIFQLNESVFLKEDSLKVYQGSLDILLEKMFLKHLPVKPIHNFSDRYAKHFGAARIPHYILNYIGKIRSLPPLEQKALLPILTGCVEEILTETIQNTRYDLKRSIHLKTVFSENPDLLREWKQGKRAPLNEYLEKEPRLEEKKVDFKKILATKILTDNHVSHKIVPILVDCLQQSLSPEVALERLKASTTVERDPLIELQRDCILLSLETKTSPRSEELLRKILLSVTLIGISEFENDLKGLLFQPSSKSTKYEGWELVDTDDPQDLFLSGTEVEGSCQRITGDALLNKCLLAYVVDGKNRLLAIKDSSGKIMSRAILRILWDGKQPVLFLERFYPNIISEEEKKSLALFALKRAQSLKLPLLSQEVGQGKTYGSSIDSLGSNAPYEYSDGSGAVTTGVYTIGSPHILSDTKL